VSKPISPDRITPQIASELTAEDAVAGMSFEQVISLARTGMVRCPGPTITQDSVFIAGMLAEAGIGSVVIARRHEVHANAADANAGGTTDAASPGPAARPLLSRQTDLPRELAVLSDDCCLIAGPMIIWRSGDRLVVALREPR